MDWKVKAFLNFAKKIKPGWRTSLLFSLILVPLELIGPRRTVAKKNIALVFPEKSPKEKQLILAQSYENIVRTGIETLAWQRDLSLINKWTVEVEGLNHVNDAFSRNRGVIVVSSHVGNWEHAAAWIGNNFNATAIVRHPDSPFQKELINILRGRTGLRILGKEEPMTRAVSILKKNEMLGLLSDQHGGGEGIMIPFFGQVTSTVKGAAVFACLTGAAIIPIQSLRIEPFRFKIILGPPVTWKKERDRDCTIQNITAQVNIELEKIVSRAPGQWLWQHKRFKEILSY